MYKIKKNNLKTVLVTVVILLVLNGIGSKFFHRFDLTKDHRYTLSSTSLKLIQTIKEPLIVVVFLTGAFPGEFKKLQIETLQLLEEFKAYNSNIVFQFVNPLENEEEKDSVMKSLMNKGLTPISVTLDNKGKQTQEIVFPWAIATYQGRSVKVPLLKNMMGASTAEKVVSSVQNLEYTFANAVHTIAKAKEKKVAIIKGNGELDDIFIADFIKQIRENYYIGIFTLDSVTKKPNQSLSSLKKYDLAIIAKPTQKFSDEEKLVLDQFVTNGGKTLWLVDQVNMEMDSLYNDVGTTLAFPNDLNLNDMFFKYGVRINSNLIKDIMATPIALASGNTGSATQFTQFPWFYSPMIYSVSKHPIVNNLEALKFEFASGIDTLKNGIKKTILLQSSSFSKLVGAPLEVKLEMVQERPEESEFTNKGNIPVAVLLEGKFHSVFENRVLPFQEKRFQAIGKNNKMIVISDGDIIKNQLDKNYQPLELGYDKWTNKHYGNKEFVMNCVNFLLDDSGLINIRNKVVNLPILDKQKVYNNYSKSQIISVGMPMLALIVFGFLFIILRKRKYRK